ERRAPAPARDRVPPHPDVLRVLVAERPARVVVGFRGLVGTLSIRARDQDHRAPVARTPGARPRLAQGGEVRLEVSARAVHRIAGASRRARVRRVRRAVGPARLGLRDPPGPRPPGARAPSDSGRACRDPVEGRRHRAVDLRGHPPPGRPAARRRARPEVLGAWRMEGVPRPRGRPTRNPLRGGQPAEGTEAAARLVVRHLLPV
ncbi:MAG: hypothetical protein AVDCRST_MAG64-1539, partial [uncultured Phycisphaerae bacterium]